MKYCQRILVRTPWRALCSHSQSVITPPIFPGHSTEAAALGRLRVAKLAPQAMGFPDTTTLRQRAAQVAE